MANKTNQINIPEARQAMYNMKHEVANELGITLNQGYNGNLSSKDAGHIGGNMVKKMIEAQERQMSGQQPASERGEFDRKWFRRDARTTAGAHCGNATESPCTCRATRLSKKVAISDLFWYTKVGVRRRCSRKRSSIGRP